MKIKTTFYLSLTIVFISSINIFSQAPVITKQPSDQSVIEGQTATFSIDVTGDTLTYQWYKNDTLIVGATDSMYTTPATVVADNGSKFSIKVTNSYGSDSSNAATLYVTSAAPVITKQPSNQWIIEGQTATFSIDVTGDTLTYQWYKNDTLIVGATDSMYTTPATVVADNGSKFSIKVTNSYGSDSSNAATLYVTATGSRVTANEIAAYDFKEGSGSVVHDVSGVGSAVNFNIDDTNSVAWTPNGLFVFSPVLIQSSINPPKIQDSCVATNELTIEAWIVPSDTVQNDAHIITYQSTSDYRRFSLIQYKRNYATKVRITPTTDPTGVPYISTNNGDVKLKLTQVVYTHFSNGTTKMYINGSEVASDTIIGDFGDWAGGGDRILGLAGDYLGQRNWSGIFYYAGIYNRALSSSEVSHNFSLGVAADTSVIIAEQPQDAFIIEGQTASFAVKATSSIILSYQWQKDGVDIAGANDAAYTTPVLSTSDNNSTYRVIVTNTSGSDTSDIAKVTVTPSNQRVTNGIQVLYNFQDGSGTVINDISGIGSPLNLNIGNPDSVEWKPYGLNLIGKASIITSSAATKIINAAISSNEITVEVWLKPASEPESGYIASCYQDASNRNFLLNQQSDSTYEFRLRTTKTNLNATPFAKTSSGVTDANLKHIVYTRDKNGNIRFYVNDQVKDSRNIAGLFSNWNSTYKFALGSILDGSNLLGVFNLVAIYNRALTTAEVDHNYTMGPVGNINLSDPSNLSAQTPHAGIVKLTWKDNSDNEDGFIIERQLSGSSFEVIDTAGANDTTYTDSAVTDTTSYNYRVKAYNLLAQSGYSNEVTIKTLLSTIPAPTELQAIKDISDTTNVKLNWKDNSSNELGFVVERKLGDTASVELFSAIDTVGTDVVTYTDTTVSDTTTYTYRVYAYNADTVSQFSNLAQITTPVPVELTSFTTNVVNGKVVLSWETATEINNSGFSVERSNDNKVFSEIAFIKGNGTTTEKIFYSYTDKSALSGIYYYRLKQVDFDGSYNYSKSIEADMGLPTSFALYQNYPNPFNPSTIIRFALPMNAKVNIKLYNTLGQEVDNILSRDMNAGVHETEFNASNLASGVYFYRLEARGTDGSNFVSTKRMLLMK